MKPQGVAVVVLTYDAAPGMLETATRSVLAAGGFDRLIVVDNGDQAHERLAGLECEVLTTGHNAGYAGGMNAGIERALELGADAVALLNDDVVVEGAWLDPLVDQLGADSSIGAVQPALLFADSDPPRVNSLGVVIDRMGQAADAGRGEPFEGGASFDIDAFTGGAVLLRREFVEQVGVFDGRYFLYYEDVELSRRGTRSGWRYRCVPRSTVRHRGSATTAALGDRTVYLQERNRLWTTFRHGSAGEVGRGLWLSVRRLRHRPRSVHARALLAGLGAMPRQLYRRWSA